MLIPNIANPQIYANEPSSGLRKLCRPSEREQLNNPELLQKFNTTLNWSYPYPGLISKDEKLRLKDWRYKLRNCFHASFNCEESKMTVEHLEFQFNEEAVKQEPLIFVDLIHAGGCDHSPLVFAMMLSKRGKMCRWVNQPAANLLSVIVDSFVKFSLENCHHTVKNMMQFNKQFVLFVNRKDLLNETALTPDMLRAALKLLKDMMIICTQQLNCPKTKKKKMAVSLNWEALAFHYRQLFLTQSDHPKMEALLSRMRKRIYNPTGHRQRRISNQAFHGIFNVILDAKFPKALPDLSQCIFQAQTA